MKNKILFLSYWYPSKEKKSFGIFIKRHAHAIALHNNVVVLALLVHHSNAFFKKEYERLRDEKDIETHYIHIYSRFNKLVYLLLPLHYFLAARYIQKNIRKNFDFDIIHSNILFPCAIVGHKLAKKYNCRHVITEHWSKLDKFFSTSIYRFAGRKALDNAGAITCVSQVLKNNVIKHTHNKNIRIVPNVVDSQYFFYDSTIKKNNLFTFIAVAHWNAPKNPFIFLDALAHLQKEKPGSFCLTLVGEGPLLDIVKERNYPFKIIYIPSLTPSELCKKLNESHVFLHGSAFETFSVVIAEALMCGIPVIASPVGVAPEIISAANGMIAQDNVDDWFAKIQSVMQKTYNASSIASEIRNKFSPEVVSDLFAGAYSFS